MIPCEKEKPEAPEKEAPERISKAISDKTPKTIPEEKSNTFNSLKGYAYLTGRTHYKRFIESCKKANALQALAQVFASHKYEAIGIELETVDEGRFFLFESIIVAEEWASSEEDRHRGIIPLYTTITTNYILATTMTATNYAC